jgi:uncharacterized protein YecE (DUF72 family)
MSSEVKGNPRVLIGTSGYSYEDWVGPVYPPGTRKEDFLSLYARSFPVVELNFSFYKQPVSSTLERMVRSTPEGFRFALKAHRSLTHEISASWERDILTFRNGVAPLRDAGRLSAVLLQFPYSFAYTPESRERLAALCGRLEGLPLAVEFRKSDWLRPQVFEGLRSRGVATVNVDEPPLPRLLPPTATVTSDLGYIRFHGRNSEKWWTGDNASRYDYLYESKELDEWTERVRAILPRVHTLLIFFNNHWRGNAAQNARMMRELLTRQELF